MLRWQRRRPFYEKSERRSVSTGSPHPSILRRSESDLHSHIPFVRQILGHYVIISPGRGQESTKVFCA